VRADGRTDDKDRHNTESLFAISQTRLNVHQFNIAYRNNRCSEIHVEHKNALCRLRVEFVNVEPLLVRDSNHWAKKG
jgi:hypothetical protein